MNQFVMMRDAAEGCPTAALKIFKKYLSYDPDTGVFTRLKSVGNQPIGSVAGNKTSHGYVRISVEGRLWRAHRLAWLFFYEVWPTDQIDHINGVRTDNRIVNLREVNNRENQSNTDKTRSGIPAGVHWDKSRGKWFSQALTKDGKKALGRYDDMEEAHAAYLKAIAE